MGFYRWVSPRGCTRIDGPVRSAGPVMSTVTRSSRAIASSSLADHMHNVNWRSARKQNASSSVFPPTLVLFVNSRVLRSAWRPRWRSVVGNWPVRCLGGAVSACRCVDGQRQLHHNGVQRHWVTDRCGVSPVWCLRAGALMTSGSFTMMGSGGAR